MPNRDRTGPQRMGPMTGGVRGLCNPSHAGTQTYFGYGRKMGFRKGGRGGFGRFRSFGPGFGGRFVPQEYAYSSSSELEMLKAEAETAKSALNAINQRIAELEQQTE